jgi:hypothetical protein
MHVKVLIFVHRSRDGGPNHHCHRTINDGRKCETFSLERSTKAQAYTSNNKNTNRC